MNEYLGEHNWEPMKGYMIVGFDIWRIIWEGKPTLSGWDNPLRRECIDRFANCQDADDKEMELRGRKEKNVSYYILPLQLKCPSEALVEK